MHTEDHRGGRALFGGLALVVAIVTVVMAVAYTVGKGSGESDLATMPVHSGSERADLPLSGGALEPGPASNTSKRSQETTPVASDRLPAGLLAPDLRVQLLTDLAFDFAHIDGETRRVVRFTTTITNTGLGPFELHSSYDEELQRTVVTQRIYGPPGEDAHDTRVGDFVFHPGHAHWHMDEFVNYRLYAFGDDGDNLGERGTQKTSFCITDDHRALELHAAPPEATYGGCDNVVQGISVGWNDIYLSDLIDQWIDLGPDDGDAFLPDGDYAIVADVSPHRLIMETDLGNNHSITYFSVQDEEIVTE
jgi:hypothetical protein